MYGKKMHNFLVNVVFPYMITCGALQKLVEIRNARINIVPTDK